MLTMVQHFAYHKQQFADLHVHTNSMKGLSPGKFLDSDLVSFVSMGLGRRTTRSELPSKTGH